MEPQLSPSIQNKSIQIASIEDKGLTLKITDQEGKKFVLWKQWEGEDTEQYATFKVMELTIGSRCRIGYTAKEKEYMNKKYTEYTIRNIMEDGHKPLEKVESVKTELHNDTYGKRLALHGFVNGLLATGKTPDEITLTMLASLLELETRIDQALQNEITTEDIPF